MTQENDVLLEDKGLILHDGEIFNTKLRLKFEGSDSEGNEVQVEIYQGIQFTGKTYFGGEPIFEILGIGEDKEVLVEKVGGTSDDGKGPIPMPEYEIGEKATLPIDMVVSACFGDQSAPSN